MTMSLVSINITTYYSFAFVLFFKFIIIFIIKLMINIELKEQMTKIELKNK